MPLGIRHVWLLSLLVAGVAWAEEPRSYPPSGLQTFLGLDDTSAPTQVQDGRAQDLQNATLSISKDLTKRFGYDLIGQNLDVANEANCAITGLYYTQFSSGTERIVSTCGSRFYYLNGTVWTQVSGSVVSGTVVSPENNQFVFTTALDEIIFTNDTNVTPLRYDGTTLTTVNFTGLSSASVPTQAKTVAFFKNFLIFGNTVENGIQRATRFRWSNVGITSTWSDEDYVDIGALGGQEINAMAELYDNLYVFLTDSIYRVSFVAGADTFNVSKVTDDIGSIAKNSVQSITLTNAQNGLIFLDKDKKIYFFDGIAPRDISQYITQTMAGLSAARLQYAVSADSNTDYYLCATNGAVAINNLCLDLQYQIGEWTKHTNIKANAIAHVLDNNSRDQVYFGTNESFTYQLNDEDLNSDVVGAQRNVVSVGTNYSIDTATGLQIIYTSGATFAVGNLTGAPVQIVSGTGEGSTSTVFTNTSTGIVVTDVFGTTPDSTSVLETGAIDFFYTTKWYDMGEPYRLKHFGELYFWAEASTNTGLLVAYATDFSANIASGIVSLSSDETDSIWGSAIWGVSLWGSQGDVFRQVKQEAGGRYLRMKFSEDDINQPVHLYGWSSIYWAGDIL